MPALSRRRRPDPDPRPRTVRRLRPDGCTEPLMLAHGFTVEMMTALAREGLVTVTAGRMVAGGRNREVAVPRITETGRRVLSGIAL